MWNQREASVAREKQHVFKSAQRLRNSHGRFASSRSLKHRGERRGVSSMPAVAAVLLPRCSMPWLSSVAAASPWVAADVDTLAASVHRRSRGTPLRKTCGGVQRDNTWVYCEHGSRDFCRPPVRPPPPPGRLRIIAAWRLGKPHVSLPRFLRDNRHRNSPAPPPASPRHSLAAAAVCGCWLRRLARCGIAEPEEARIPLGSAHHRHCHRG